MGNNEELVEGQVGAGGEAPEAGALPEAELAPEAVVPGVEGEEQLQPPDDGQQPTVDLDTLPPEVAAEIARVTEAATNKIVEKYEGKGGDIARLKSKYDQRLAEERRRRQALEQAQVQEAMAMVEDDPGRAAQLMAGQLQQQQMQYVVENARRDWTDWVRGQYEAAGISLEDEAVAEEAAGAVESLLQQAMGGNGQAAALNFQTFVYQKAHEQKDKALAEKGKELSKLQASIQEQVKQEVARYLSDSGQSPDATVPGPKPGQGIRNQNNPDVLLAEGMAEIVASGNRPGGRRRK